MASATSGFGELHAGDALGFAPRLRPAGMHADFAAYEGKLQGKIVLAELPREVAFESTPSGRRFTGRDLAEIAEAYELTELEQDALLQHKSLYLNVPFFLTRAAIYFGAWIALAAALNRWSQRQDGGDPTATRRMQMLSGGGLVLYGLTITFASVDWVMSINPHWFSTIFGFLFMGGQGLAALAFAIAVATLLAQHEPMRGVFTVGHFHDLGKLMLAFVMLWAYFSFSQYLIIYSGNLPEEITWYTHRLFTGWRVIALLLVVCFTAGMTPTTMIG